MEERSLNSRPSKKVIFGGDRSKNVPFKCGQIALEKGRNSTYDYKWHRNPLARHPPGSARHLPPKKKCLVPREIPLAAVVSRSDDDDDDARLHYRDLYHFRLRMRYDSAPLGRSLVADRYARSRAHSLLARGKDGGMMKCRCRVRDWEKVERPPSLLFLHFAPAPSVHHRPGRSARSPPPGARARTDGQRRSNQLLWLAAEEGGREGGSGRGPAVEGGREGDRGCGMERSYQ